MKTDAKVRKLCKCYDFVWATRRVAEEGVPVSYMLRKKPNDALPSSGWLSLSKEDEDGIVSAEEIQMISLERVLAHSPAIAEHLHLPPGSHLQLRADGRFALIHSEPIQSPHPTTL